MPIISLSYNVDPVITRPIDEIAYLIRHFIYNPGFTSSFFPDQEISLRGLVGRYPKNPALATNLISEQLKAAIRRVVTELEVEVDATFVLPDENSNEYTLKLSITDVLGNLLIPISMITVKDQQVSVKYEGI